MALSTPQPTTDGVSSILVLHLSCDVAAIGEDLKEVCGEAFAESDVSVEVYDRARRFVHELVKGTSFAAIDIVHAIEGDVTAEARFEHVCPSRLKIDRALIQSRQNLVSWNISLKYLTEENA